MSEKPGAHPAAYIADRDRKIRQGWYVDHGDLCVLSEAVKQAAFYIRDRARPGSELFGFAEPLFRLSEVIFDATEALSRREHGIEWSAVLDFFADGRRDGGR